MKKEACILWILLILSSCVHVTPEVSLSPAQGLLFNEPSKAAALPETPSKEKLKEKINKLIPRIGSENYREREEATRKLCNILRKSGADRFSLVDYLGKLAHAAADPEVKHRLEYVIRHCEYFEILRVIETESCHGSAAVFSPDGKTIMSADGKKVLVWDLNSGSCVHTLGSHKDWVYSVSFSADGKMAASGDSKGEVIIWNIQAEKCLHRLNGHADYVDSVSFSPDGKILASGCRDNKIILWDTGTGERLRTLDLHKDIVYSVEFSPDGKILASGSFDSTVRLWNPLTGECLHVLDVGEKSVLRVVFSPDGGLLAAGGGDGIIRLWDIEKNECIRKLAGHDDIVEWISFSPNGKMLISAGNYGSVILWNVQTGSQLFKVVWDKTFCKSVEFSPDGKKIAVGRCDTTKTGNNSRILSNHTTTIWTIPGENGQ